MSVLSRFKSLAGKKFTGLEEDPSASPVAVEEDDDMSDVDRENFLREGEAEEERESLEEETLEDAIARRYGNRATREETDAEMLEALQSGEVQLGASDGEGSFMPLSEASAEDQSHVPVEPDEGEVEELVNQMTERMTTFEEEEAESSLPQEHLEEQAGQVEEAVEEAEEVQSEVTAHVEPELEDQGTGEAPVSDEPSSPATRTVEVDTISTVNVVTGQPIPITLAPEVPYDANPSVPVNQPTQAETGNGFRYPTPMEQIQPSEERIQPTAETQSVVEAQENLNAAMTEDEEVSEAVKEFYHEQSEVVNNAPVEEEEDEDLGDIVLGGPKQFISGEVIEAVVQGGEEGLLHRIGMGQVGVPVQVVKLRGSSKIQPLEISDAEDAIGTVSDAIDQYAARCRIRIVPSEITAIPAGIEPSRHKVTEFAGKTYFYPKELTGTQLNDFLMEAVEVLRKGEILRKSLFMDFTFKGEQRKTLYFSPEEVQDLAGYLTKYNPKIVQVGEQDLIFVAGDYING